MPVAAVSAGLGCVRGVWDGAPAREAREGREGGCIQT